MLHGPRDVLGRPHLAAETRPSRVRNPGGIRTRVYSPPRAFFATTAGYAMLSQLRRIGDENPGGSPDQLASAYMWETFKPIWSSKLAANRRFGAPTPTVFQPETRPT